MPRRNAPTASRAAEKAGEELLLTMGLDFGTAFSKVVVRAPDLPDEPAYAVRFDGLADASSPYLLPTSLSISGDGVFSLNGKGMRLPHDVKQPDIKYGLMTGAADMDARGRKIPYADACAAYLALVVCRAKESFMREYGQNFAGYAPEWEEPINIGIPAATKSDNPRKRAFQRTANAALALADGGGEITVDSAAEAIKRAGDDDDRCLLMPEIAAQIQGYKRSDVGRDGLHIIADAGASTLDICSFTLLLRPYRDGSMLRNTKQGDITVCYADVLKLGVNILKRKINGLSGEDAEKVEEAFWHDCQKGIREAVWGPKHIRKLVIPDALPLLLCGGGAAMDGYKKLPERAEKGLLTGGKRFDVRQMPMPGNLEPKSLPLDMYHRLSVAYGLSNRSFDDVVLPSDMPMPPESGESEDSSEPAWKNNYIGKEQT